MMPPTKDMQDDGALHLFELFDQGDFDKALQDRLITIREDGRGLRILNYSDSAMYTPGAWDNPAVRACRGIIVDDDLFVRARPWAKFFNYGQPEAGDLDLSEPVEVTDKMDGSLGIIHLDTAGRLRVATRGSFESDQAIHATELIRAYPYLHNIDRVTPLVEIIYPANRIVVDYGDNDALVLLGGVDILSGEYLSPLTTALFVGWAGPLTEVFNYATLADALAAEPRPGMEGLCVRSLDRNHIVKIKQEEYVRLHRIVTGLSERSVWEHMSTPLPLTDLLDGIPDELHTWVREVWNRIESDVAFWTQSADMAHAEILHSLPDGWTRKEYAASAVTYGNLKSYLFQLLDGRDIRPSILRNLKPEGDTRARPTSEAVA